MAVQIISVSGDSRFELDAAFMTGPFPWGSNWWAVNIGCLVTIPGAATIGSLPYFFLGVCQDGHPVGDPSITKAWGVGLGTADFVYDGGNGVYSLTGGQDKWEPGRSTSNTAAGFLPAVSGVQVPVILSLVRSAAGAGSRFLGLYPGVIAGAQNTFTGANLRDVLSIHPDGSADMKSTLDGISGGANRFAGTTVSSPLASAAGLDHWGVWWNKSTPKAQVSAVYIARHY